jgi:hypothetical protein
MDRERLIGVIEVAERYGYDSLQGVNYTLKKYGLKPEGFNGNERLFVREDIEEVFGGLEELRKGNRNVVFRLPKYCTKSDLADILDIPYAEARKYFERFPMAVKDFRNSKIFVMEMTDDIWREVLR